MLTAASAREAQPVGRGLLLPPGLPLALGVLAAGVAVAAVACCLWGWWRHPLVLAANFQEEPFHPLTRSLILLVFEVASCGLWADLPDPQEPLTRAQRWVIGYLAMAYHAEVYYLVLFFHPGRHVAMTA